MKFEERLNYSNVCFFCNVFSEPIRNLFSLLVFNSILFSITKAGGCSLCWFQSRFIIRLFYFQIKAENWSFIIIQQKLYLGIVLLTVCCFIENTVVQISVILGRWTTTMILTWNNIRGTLPRHHRGQLKKAINGIHSAWQWSITKYWFGFNIALAHTNFIFNNSYALNLLWDLETFSRTDCESCHCFRNRVTHFNHDVRNIFNILKLMNTRFLSPSMLRLTDELLSVKLDHIDLRYLIGEMFCEKETGIIRPTL